MVILHVGLRPNMKLNYVVMEVDKAEDCTADKDPNGV